MHLERVFNARLEQIVRCDSVSVRHVEIRPAAPNPQRQELLAKVDDATMRKSLDKLYRDHDGIEIEWDGSIEAAGVHGSLNISNLALLIERISQGNLQRKLELDPHKCATGEITAWAEIEQQFGSSNSIYLYGQGFNSMCMRVGERLAPTRPTSRTSLEALVDLLGIDGARTALLAKNWREECKAVAEKIERLD